MIRTANLSIVVENPAKTMDAVIQMATDMGGFVVSSDLRKTTVGEITDIPAANVTIRVPAERLNEALSQIKSQTKDPSKDVTSETITGQDVTQEFTDLNSRKKNLEETEQQLREIMKSAQKTQDVLDVYQQVSSVRGQIEVLQGQIQYYQESSSFSAISVVITAQEAIQPIQTSGWQAAGIVRNSLQALVNTMQFFASVAIWLVLYLLPVALVILVPLAVLFWLVRWFMRRRKPATTLPPASAD